jgi:hypothetical protein
MASATDRRHSPAGDPRSREERTKDVTSPAAVAFSPAEEAEAIVEEAERDRGVAESSGARAFLEILLRPLPVLRAAAPTAWQSGLVIVAGATLLRAATFTAFSASSGSPLPAVLLGAVTGLASPFLFAAVAAGVLLAVRASGERRTAAAAFSLAFLATMPIALKALLQTVAMVVTRHALHPSGILGIVAPDSPALVRSLLGPVDLFAVWAVALVIVAALPVRESKRGEREAASA